MILQSDFGLRARISLEEKGIIITQNAWPPIKEILKYKNIDLICNDGDEKATDFSKMRSYCYYNGNCMSLGLESLFIQIPQGEVFEIIKSQYTLQHTDPFRCEIMIQAWPDTYLQEMNEIDILIGQPLLFNYYSIFDVKNGKIGLAQTLYTRT
jgi:hypothetical protein